MTKGRVFKVSTVIFATIALLFAAWVVLVRYMPPQLFYRSEIKQTTEVIQQIEKYRAKYGVYPTESQYQLPKEDMFYILKDGGYIVGFSVGFDESYSYDSRTKRWSFD